MFTLPQIDTGKYNIHYLEARGLDNRGSLLFIHGAGGEGALWGNLLSGLPAGFVGIAPDLPGHNQSEGESCSAIDDYAAAMVDLLDALNLPRPMVLVGHSMGGAIALTMALTKPEAIDGLVLIGSGARLQVAPSFLELLEAGIMDGNFLNLGFAAATSEAIRNVFLDTAAQVPVTTFFRDFSACSRFDVREQVGRLQIPLLLLVGDEDRLTPVKLSKYIQEQLPKARLTIIPSAGHFAMLEQPDAIRGALSDFVSTL